MFSNTDIDMMKTALALAWQGRFSTSPNPRVGCVIVKGQQIVGQGFHIQAGGPHAEVHALRQAGHLAQGATAYVTLEPCSHYGKTPPCAKALIEAGVTRVVAAMTDPNPLVSGKGLAMLQAANIQVESGLLAEEARMINRGFLSRIERKGPFIRLKCATSLDGKIALSDGQSQWITGEEARADVQVLRAESCAIITGIGTVLADNPQLTVRAFPTLRQPARVVLDSKLQIPMNSKLVQDNIAPTIIATLNHNQSALNPYLKQTHIHFLKPSEYQGQIDLHDLLAQLASMGYGEVMVEAGSTLTSAFLKADLVDEIVLYQSSKILGESAKSLFLLPENKNILHTESQWETSDLTKLGHDIKWVLHRKSGYNS